MPKAPSAPIVAPTIVRVTYKHLNGSNRAADCVMDISVESVAGLDRPDAVSGLISHVAAPWQDHVLDALSNSVTFLGGSFIDLDSLGGATGTFGPAVGHPTHGSGTSADMTTQVAYLIHKNTASHRGQRPGRTYLPGCLESAVDGNGNVTTAQLGTLNTDMAAYLDAINSITFGAFSVQPAIRVVHVHKPDKLDPTTWTWSSTDVTSFTADTRVATQRRRLR